MRISANFLNHLSFWFVTLFATPLFIALNNRADIPFPPGLLAATLFAACLGASLLTAGLGRLAGRRFARRLGLLLAGLALVLAVQSNVVHDLFFYGNFNGERVDFRAHGQAFWYEWWGFLAALAAVTLLLQWRQPRGRWLAALPIASSLLLLAPMLTQSGGSAGSTGPDEAIVPGVFGFSRNGNLVHLLPDGFQSDVVRQVLEEHPDLAAQFEGFTLFANHLGMFQGTAPAVPTILTGRPFDLAAGHDYQRVIADIQAEGYPSRLKEAGFRLDYVLISTAYCAAGADSCVSRPFNDLKARGYYRHHAESREYALRILADLTLFRLLPMRVKEKIYDDGHWHFGDTTADGSSPWPDPVIREWTANMQVNDGPPAFKYYHFIGTHIPPHWDAECHYRRNLERSRESYLAQAHCVLQGIAALLAELKRQGIYDRTAFVISGDHGHGIPPADEVRGSQQSALQPAMMGSARPAFLVKEMDRRGPLRFSDAPTSLVDVAPTALALAGQQVPESGVSALDLEPGAPRTRYFLPYSIRDLFSGGPVPHAVYRVDGDVRDSRNWIVAGIRPFRTAPSGYDPVNWRNGEHFLVGARFNTNEPDSEATWVNGRQLAFLLSRPADAEGPLQLKFALHLPEWLGEQRMDVEINGRKVAEGVPAEPGKGYWTQVVVELEGAELAAENNFVSVRFANTAFPPGISHFEVAAMIRSIRLVRKPASGTSTGTSSRP